MATGQCHPRLEVLEFSGGDAPLGYGPACLTQPSVHKLFLYRKQLLTRLPKLIWQQAASPPMVTDPLTIPKRHLERFGRYCTAYAAFSLCYMTLCRLISPPNLSLTGDPAGDLDGLQLLTHRSLALPDPTNPSSISNLDRFSPPTDRPTERRR